MQNPSEGEAITVELQTILRFCSVGSTNGNMVAFVHSAEVKDPIKFSFNRREDTDTIVSANQEILHSEPTAIELC